MSWPRKEPTPPETRFWPKVAKGEGCWEWQGGRTGSNGHGRFAVRATRPAFKVMAHRYSWELANGPIPSGMEVCHTCDNPICVRPDHLFLGTHTDNMRDASRKGRIYAQRADWSLCRRGHPMTGDNVRRTSSGRRRCAECTRIGERARRHRDIATTLRYIGDTPAGLRGAADKLGEAMG